MPQSPRRQRLRPKVPAEEPVDSPVAVNRLWHHILCKSEMPGRRAGCSTYTHRDSLVVWSPSALSRETIVLKCKHSALRWYGSWLDIQKQIFSSRSQSVGWSYWLCIQSHLALRASYQASSSGLYRTSLTNNRLSGLFTVKHTLPGSSGSLRLYRYLVVLDCPQLRG